MALVELSRGAFSVIDDSDLEAVTNEGPWQAVICGKKLYARRSRVVGGENVIIYMHTFLTGFKITDHVNGITLDNRRENLREATYSQNAQNVTTTKHLSGFKGVSFHKKSGLWHAVIHKDRRTISLKYHHSPESAAKAYDIAALRLFGEFANTNFPKEEYPQWT